MNRPLESDYTSQVAYTRALEAYCDSLAQPAQEPVATIAVRWHEPVGKVAYVLEVNLPVGIHNLYTTPPQRTWVDLTDEEISALSKGHMTRNGFARNVIAKFKDKNK